MPHKVPYFKKYFKYFMHAQPLLWNFSGSLSTPQTVTFVLVKKNVRLLRTSYKGKGRQSNEVMQVDLTRKTLQHLRGLSKTRRSGWN